MTNFSPKELFQQTQKEACAKLQENREQSWLMIAMAFTFSEMADTGATQEQLAGARRFIQVFQNLWEKPEALPRLPEQRLATYESTDSLVDQVAKAKKEGKL